MFHELFVTQLGNELSPFPRFHFKEIRASDQYSQTILWIEHKSGKNSDKSVPVGAYTLQNCEQIINI